MQFRPLILASTISLLLLTACGGGGGSTNTTDTPPDTQPNAKNSINLMLATSPDDNYFASAQSEGESLALFTANKSESAMSDTLIYNNTSDQVSFIRTVGATSYDRMLINGYQFDSTPTDSGAEIVVTVPSGQQETYYVDSNGEFTQEIGGNENPAISEVTSCIATTAETSFCMDLEPIFYSESYCTVNGLNAQEGSDGIFTSASYATSLRCAERGYPYNLSANNVEGWSAWFAEPVPGSTNYLAPLPTRSLFERNPFDTSACHEQMYDDDTAWSTCINQQITAFTAHAQVGFSEIFRNVVETYYNDLLPAFEKAKAFVEKVEAQQSFNHVIVNTKNYISEDIAQANELATSVGLGLSELFDDMEDGTVEDNYTGIGSLNDIYGENGKGITEDNQEPEEPSSALCLAVNTIDLDPNVGGITGVLCNHDKNINGTFSTQEDIRACFAKTDFNRIRMDNGNLYREFASMSCGLKPKGEVHFWVPNHYGKLSKIVTANYDEDGFYDGLYQAYSEQSDDLVILSGYYSHGSRNGVHHRYRVQICDLNVSPEFCLDDNVFHYTPISDITYIRDDVEIAARISITGYKFNPPEMPDIEHGSFTYYYPHLPKEVIIKGTKKFGRSVEVDFYIGECPNQSTDENGSIIGSGLPMKGFIKWQTEFYDGEGSYIRAISHLDQADKYYLFYTVGEMPETNGHEHLIRCYTIFNLN